MEPEGYNSVSLPVIHPRPRVQSFSAAQTIMLARHGTISQAPHTLGRYGLGGLHPTHDILRVEMTSSPALWSGKDNFQDKNEIGPKLIVAMVGLPARGKSYIVRRLKRYLSW